VRPKTLATVLVLAAVAFLGFGPSTVAFAAESQDLGVRPSVVLEGQSRPVFVLFISPGATVRDSVSLINKTDREMTVDLYPADAVNTNDGSFALRKSDDEMSGVGAWVSLPTSQVTLPAGTETRVPFELTVPADATPGDHAGGIVALDTAQRALGGEGDVDFAVRSGVAARIYTRVNGPLTPQLTVSEVTIDKSGGVPALLGLSTGATVTYTITNTGNVRLSPTAAVGVDPMLGSNSVLEPEPLPELVPGSSVTVTRPLGVVSSIGQLEVSVAVTAADSGNAAPVGAVGKASLVAVPWLLVALVIVLDILAIRWFRRRRRVGLEGPDAAPPPPSNVTASVSS